MSSTLGHDLNPPPPQEQRDMQMEGARRDLWQATQSRRARAVQLSQWEAQRAELAEQHGQILDQPNLPHGALPQINMNPVFQSLEPWGLDAAAVEDGAYMEDPDVVNPETHWMQFNVHDLIDGVLGRNPEVLRPLAKMPTDLRGEWAKAYPRWVENRLHAQAISKWALAKRYGADWETQMRAEGESMPWVKYGKSGGKALIHGLMMEEWLGILKATGANPDADAMDIAEDWVKKNLSDYADPERLAMIRQNTLMNAYQARGLTSPMALSISQSIGTMLSFVFPLPGTVFKVGGKLATGATKSIVYGAGKFAPAVRGAFLRGVKGAPAENWLAQVVSSELRGQRMIAALGSGALYEQLQTGEPLGGAVGFGAAHAVSSLADAIFGQWVPPNAVAKILKETGIKFGAGAALGVMPSMSSEGMETTTTELAIKALRSTVGGASLTPDEWDQLGGTVLGSALGFSALGLLHEGTTAWKWRQLNKRGATLESLIDLPPSRRRQILELVVGLIQPEWIKRGSPEEQALTEEQRKSVIWKGDQGLYFTNTEGAPPNLSKPADVALMAERALYDAFTEKNPARVLFLGSALHEMGEKLGGPEGKRITELGQWISNHAGQRFAEQHPYTRFFHQNIRGIPVPTWLESRPTITRAQAAKSAARAAEMLKDGLATEPNAWSAPAEKAPGKQPSSTIPGEGPTPGNPWDIKPGTETFNAPGPFKTPGWIVAATQDGPTRRLTFQYRFQQKGGMFIIEAIGEKYQAWVVAGDRVDPIGEASSLAGLEMTMSAALAGRIEPGVWESFRGALQDALSVDVRGSIKPMEWFLGRQLAPGAERSESFLRASEHVRENLDVISADQEAADNLVSNLRSSAVASQNEEVARILDNTARLLEAASGKSPLAIDSGTWSIDNLEKSVRASMSKAPREHKYWLVELDAEGWRVEPVRESERSRANLVMDRTEFNRMVASDPDGWRAEAENIRSQPLVRFEIKGNNAILEENLTTLLNTPPRALLPVTEGVSAPPVTRPAAPKTAGLVKGQEGGKYPISLRLGEAVAHIRVQGETYPYLGLSQASHLGAPAWAKLKEGMTTFIEQFTHLDKKGLARIQDKTAKDLQDRAFSTVIDTMAKEVTEEGIHASSVHLVEIEGRGEIPAHTELLRYTDRPLFLPSALRGKIPVKVQKLGKLGSMAGVDAPAKLLVGKGDVVLVDNSFVPRGKGKSRRWIEVLIHTGKELQKVAHIEGEHIEDTRDIDLLAQWVAHKVLQTPQRSKLWSSAQAIMSGENPDVFVDRMFKSPQMVELLATEAMESSLDSLVLQGKISAPFRDFLIHLPKRAGLQDRLDTLVVVAGELNLFQAFSPLGDPGHPVGGVVGTLGPKRKGLSSSEMVLIGLAAKPISEHVGYGIGEAQTVRELNTLYHEWIHYYTLHNMTPAKQERLLLAISKALPELKSLPPEEAIAYFGGALLLALGGSHPVAIKESFRGALSPRAAWTAKALNKILQENPDVKEWVDNTVRALKVSMNQVKDALYSLTAANAKGENLALTSEDLAVGDFHPVPTYLAGMMASKARYVGSATPGPLTKADLQSHLAILTTFRKMLRPWPKRKRGAGPAQETPAAREDWQTLNEQWNQQAGRTEFLYALAGAKPGDIAMARRLGINAGLQDWAVGAMAEKEIVLHRGHSQAPAFQDQAETLDQAFANPYNQVRVDAWRADPRMASFVAVWDAERAAWAAKGPQHQLFDLARNMDAQGAGEVFLATGLSPFVGGPTRYGYDVALPAALSMPHTMPDQVALPTAFSRQGRHQRMIATKDDVLRALNTQRMIDIHPDGAALAAAHHLLRALTADTLAESQGGRITLSAPTIAHLGGLAKILDEAAITLSGGRTNFKGIAEALAKVSWQEVTAAMGAGDAQWAKVERIQARAARVRALLEGKLAVLDRPGRLTDKEQDHEADLTGRLMKLDDLVVRAISEATGRYHDAVPGVSAPQGGNISVRVGINGDIGNMNTVRWVNSMAQILEPFGVEIRVFTKKPELGRHILHPNAVVLGSLEPESGAITSLAKNPLPTVFHLTTPDPADYAQALNLYTKVAKDHGVKDPLANIVSLVPGSWAADPQALHDVFQVFRSAGMNPGALVATDLSSRAMGERFALVRRKAGISRELILPGPDGDIRIKELGTLPEDTYRTELFSRPYTELPSGLWDSVLGMVAHDEVRIRHALGVESRIKSLLPYLGTIQSQTLTELALAAKAAKTPGQEIMATAARAGGGGVFLPAQARFMQMVQEQTGAEGLATWVNATRLASGRGTPDMDGEARLWHPAGGARLVKVFKAALKAHAGPETLLAAAKEITEGGARPDADGLLRLGYWSGANLASDQINSGKNTPPVTRLITAMDHLLRANQAAKAGKANVASRHLQDAKGIFQSGPEIQLLLQGTALHRAVGEAFKRFRDVSLNGPDQVTRWNFAHGETGPHENSIPGAIRRINEFFRWGVKRIPQAFLNTTAGPSEYDPYQADLHFHQQAAIPFARGPWSDIRRNFGEAEWMWGTNVQTVFADAQQRAHHYETKYHVQLFGKGGPFHRMKDNSLETRLIIDARDAGFDVGIRRIQLELLKSGTEGLQAKDLQAWLTKHIDSPERAAELFDAYSGLRIQGKSGADLVEREANLGRMEEEWRTFWIERSPEYLEMTRGIERAQTQLSTLGEQVEGWKAEAADIPDVPGKAARQKATQRWEKLSEQMGGYAGHHAGLDAELQEILTKWQQTDPVLTRTAREIARREKWLAKAAQKRDAYRASLTTPAKLKRGAGKLADLANKIKVHTEAVFSLKKQREERLALGPEAHPKIIRLRGAMDVLEAKMKLLAPEVKAWLKRASEADERVDDAGRARLLSLVKRGELKLLRSGTKLQDLEFERDDLLADWGILWHVPHVWDGVHPSQENLSGWRAGVLRILLGHRAASWKSGNARATRAGLPASLPFRYGRHRLGKEGYSKSPRFLYRNYLNTLAHTAYMNEALQVLSPLVNGRATKVTPRNTRPGDGWDAQAEDYNRKVTYRGIPARIIDMSEGLKPIYTVQLKGEEVTRTFTPEEAADLKIRSAGFQHIMDNWTANRWQEYIDEVVFRKKPHQTTPQFVNNVLGRTVQKIFYHTMLGLANTKSAANNVIGGQLMNMVEYGPRVYFKGLAELARHPSECWRRADGKGVLESRLTAEMAGHDPFAAKSLMAMAEAASFSVFQVAEAFNRVTAYTMGESSGRRQGMSTLESHMAGVRGVARTQFLFTGATTPEAFKGEGLIGYKTMFHLWQYMARFNGQMFRWIKETKEGHPEKLLRWFTLAAGGTAMVRNVFGLDLRGLISTRLADLPPPLDRPGKSIEHAVGWHPGCMFDVALPGLAPFDFASVPTAVAADALMYGAAYMAGDAMAFRRFWGKRARTLVGRTPMALRDMFEVEQYTAPPGADDEEKKRYRARFAQTIGEMIGLDKKTGPVKRDAPSFMAHLWAALGPGQSMREAFYWWLYESAETMTRLERSQRDALRDMAYQALWLDKEGDSVRALKAMEGVRAMEEKTGQQIDWRKLQKSKVWQSWDFPDHLRKLLTHPNPQVAMRAMTMFMHAAAGRSEQILDPHGLNAFEKMQRPRMKNNPPLLWKRYNAAKARWIKKQHGEKNR